MPYDAAAFLENLYRPDLSSAPALTEADLPPDWHMLWDERAAIMEYDGGLPRERAEALALALILDQMRQADGRAGIHS